SVQPRNVAAACDRLRGGGHDSFSPFAGAPALKTFRIYRRGRTSNSSPQTEVAIRKSATAMEIDVEFLPANVNPTAEMAFGMVKGEILSAVSIGFIPRRIAIEMHDGKDVPVITESELLEVSLVGVPSNSHALVTNRATSELMAADIRIAFEKTLVP